MKGKKREHVPRRVARLDVLEPRFRAALEGMLEELRGRRWDPVVIETRRSVERQDWLYSIGRRGRRGERPVTWTRCSRHQVGEAADVISGELGWDDAWFFEVMAEVARDFGLMTLPHDMCHVQWRRRRGPG